MTAPDYYNPPFVRPPAPQRPLLGPRCPARGTLLFQGITGSHAYGLATEDSDEDWRGVFAYPTADFLGLQRLPETVHAPEGDATWWEAKHFMAQLVKGSVNAHELLWLAPEHVTYTSPLWDTLRTNEVRTSLFSARLYRAWVGMTRAYGHELAARGPAWPERNKHAMHMLRLSAGLLRTLSTGEIRLRGPEDYVLRLVRTGIMSAEKAIEWAEQDLQDAERAWADAPWPDEPDTARLNEILVGYRLSALSLPC